MGTGCVAYYGAYGGPVPDASVGASLARELKRRDLKLSLEFDCSPWKGLYAPGCLAAVAVVRSTMLEHDVLWTPDPERSDESGPRYTMHLLLGADMSSYWWFLIFPLTIVTLFTVVPQVDPQMRIMAALVSERGRGEQDPLALEHALERLETIDKTNWLLGGTAVTVEDRVVASAAHTHRVRYVTSLFLPSAWMGGRGHRRAIFMGPPGVQPGAREPFEAAAVEILHELVQQIPESP